MLVSEILELKGKVLYTITSDKKLAEAVSIMSERNVGSLACFSDGRMVGMLTFREVLRLLNREHAAWGGVLVGDVMLRDFAAGHPDMEVNELRQLMVQKHIRYLPVMEGAVLLGILSFHDVAKAVLDEQGFENRMLKAYIHDWPEGEQPA